MDNSVRGQAALVALKAFNEHLPNGELDEVVGDLLCNLMHLLGNDPGFEHLDFESELESARRYYEEETL